MKTVLNIRDFGATGNGYSDDQPAIQAATMAALACNGAVYVPPGQYLAKSEIGFPTTAARIAFFGDGSNVSTIYAQGCSALNLNFAQNGAQQPYGATIRNLGIRALGKCPLGIRVSYGQPVSTNDHNQPALTMSNLLVASDGEGSFTDGILIEGAWNPTLENVFISGYSHGGQWNELAGTGVELRGMCVNAHLTNVRFNFFQTGLKAHGSAAGNTEGIFCSNCSMVGTQRGVWIKGVLDGTGRISTFEWKGGMIESRFTGVGAQHGKAAFHFERVWTTLVQGCQMLGDTIDCQGISYGVIPQECHGVVVSGCDINAFNQGVFTTGDCRAMNINGNTFTNVAFQVVFTNGTVSSRSYGHTLVNNIPMEIDESKLNKMGFVN